MYFHVIPQNLSNFIKTGYSLKYCKHGLKLLLIRYFAEQVILQLLPQNICCFLRLHIFFLKKYMPLQQRVCTDFTASFICSRKFFFDIISKKTLRNGIGWPTANLVFDINFLHFTLSNFLCSELVYPTFCNGNVKSQRQLNVRNNRRLINLYFKCLIIY